VAGVTDINCDMGEGFGRWALGDDARLIGEITSASIACGFHAGDPRTMDATVALAADAGVRIGAHVAYPDLAGFGRRHLTVSVEQLVTDVLFQVGALQAFCTRHHTSVRYVKAHGALYNDLAEDVALADGLADAVLALDAGLVVLTLAGSPSLAVMGERGVSVVGEAFADRAYTAEGRLVPRSQPGALITDPRSVADRAWRIAAGEPIDARDGTPITIRATSLCVHGDSPGAVALAGAVRRSLTDHEIPVAPFA
jgi:UPF0271 protein